jgi:hypothetical protein
LAACYRTPQPANSLKFIGFGLEANAMASSHLAVARDAF